MLYIFDKTENLIAWLKPDFTRSSGSSSGYAFLMAEFPADFGSGSEPTEGCPYWDAVHREVLNGENTFVFTVPGNLNDTTYIQEGNLVAFRDQDSYWQVFEIKRLVDLHGDGLTRTAYCEHIFYELLDDIVTDKRPSAGATAALAGMLENTRWMVSIVDDLGASSTSVYYESALSGVQKVAEAWAGELNWRCVIVGGVITRYVDLLAMRGTDTGKQFAYSKDILSIEREVDSSNVTTALYGRGKGVELDSGSYGRRLTFADVVAADKPLGQEWIGDNAALAQWGRGGRHRFDVFTDEEETDPAALLEKTRAELAKRKVPRVTYRLDVASLEELTGYEHEKVRLGDLVRVIDREFKPELVVSARVIDIERDILNPANTKIILGSFSPTIVEATINTAKRVSDIVNRPYNTKWLDGQISVLQNAINSAMSNWWTDQDGNLIFEARDGLSAMKLAGEGFAIANQKIEGQWNWRTFGDGSGFTADLITAGIIDAGLVQIGPQTTFEDGYDPSKQHPVGMGADTNCTGLWHFDGSLNSHKGVPAVFDGVFANSKWGQGLSVATGKTLKILSEDILDSGESSINMLAYNLAESPNGSVIFDMGDSDGNQAIKVGIADDGKLFIEDSKVEYVKAETSQADFNTGTLTNVVSNPTGDLTLDKEGTDFAATEDTQADFAAGVLSNTEYNSGLKLEYTPGSLTYGTDFTGGKTYSASSQYSETYAPSKAFDNNESTQWLSSTTPGSHWLKVDLGVGVTKVARKVAIKGASTPVSLQGSNNDYSWTDVCFIENPDITSVYEYIFNNTVGYRYYRFYAANTYYGFSIYEAELMEATENPGTYALSGTWEKEYSLAAVGVARGSVLAWNATTPANTSIVVQAAIALDGVSYGSYANCTSGYVIPGITAGIDLSSAKMKIKVTLTTTDTSVTPSLNSLASWVTSAYKTSGNRVHVYDISGVGIAELSQITWDATLPTGTSVAVKAAISTDGGSTYGAFQTCTSGQAIPVLTEDMDISNARLKIQEDLATSNYATTPKLNSFNFSVSKVANVAYGINKSDLTDWDNIAIQWKTERLSLLANGVEIAYIENPGLVTVFGDYAYIGCDKLGANQIGTTIDELRVDKVYQPIDKVLAWCMVNAPFYTSEEFAQWPGYIRTETDGLKVYDSEGNLRVLLGSWMEDLLREYGLEIIGGRIYASLIKSGGKDAVNYIQFAPPNKLEVYGTNNEGVGYKMMEIETELNPGSTGGSGINFYKYSDFSGLAGGLGREGNNIVLYSVYDDLLLSSVHVMGDITKTGSYSAVEPTDDYGTRLLYAAETPELLYYDRGVINLVNGEAKVYLDPIFLQCIEPDSELTPWQVWVECYGENSVYVSEAGLDYFKVKERNAGTSNNKVVWRLEATRKNYAGIRLMEVVK